MSNEDHLHSHTPSEPATKRSVGLRKERSKENHQLERRLPAPTPHAISKGAMIRNTIPCSKKGTSASNCQQSSQGNPYSRGCSPLEHCRKPGCEYGLFSLS
ncbi:hypothetical protein CROQUDRAFT_50147 [Cronartium quercuum f. sp. fusiforme G11]|uniref:Uncharacterized protein n=1 Tax=Cronartium quercuum f. sp. fusiforme G11 TaxID=708437 RepID=A0A9P6NF47_9BASI|nr:hypothetical protein CROQUDRAFT_50147 [Cronartium quercuum f. sp. fusiforme G11]